MHYWRGSSQGEEFYSAPGGLLASLFSHWTRRGMGRSGRLERKTGYPEVILPVGSARSAFGCQFYQRGHKVLVLMT